MHVEARDDGQEAKTQNPQKYLECCATALPAEYVSSHFQWRTFGRENITDDSTFNASSSVTRGPDTNRHPLTTSGGHMNDTFDPSSLSVWE
jgi:hypothetical protein